MHPFDHIDPTLIEALKTQNITEPTQVQETVISRILENKDLIVQAETGSGKTLAYLLPLFERFKEPKREQQVLILVPTYELAMQVYQQIELLVSRSTIPMTAAVIIGNVNIERQIEKLKEKPQIIVGTAGRILKLIEKRKVTAHTVKTIVLDEADRLLDKTNQEATKAVIKTTLKDRQVLLFSASILDSTIETARGFMKEPEVLKINQGVAIPQSIEHIFFICERRDKIEMLKKVARIVNPKKAIVFENKPEEIEEITDKLRYSGFGAESLYGENDKFDRKSTTNDFKEGKLEYLVASDIAARGLHFDDVTCVFNMNIAEDPKVYLHRAGRTGRNNQPGLVVSFVTEEEIPLIRKYAKTYQIEIQCKNLFKGKIVDPK